MNQVLTCMIIDDDRNSIELLKHYVGLMPQLKLLGTETDPITAQGKLLHEEVDFLLLDGEMPGLNGVQLVQSLPKPPKVIMCTAHERFATQGFEIGAVDFLMKPVSFKHFTNAIHLVFKALGLNRMYTEKKIDVEYFFVPEFKSTYKVRLDVIGILCIESFGNYVTVYTREGKITTRLTLAEMLDRLPDDDFMQVHKGFIIAKNRIQKYNSTEILLHGFKRAIPLSSTFYKDFNAAMERRKNK